MAKRCQVLQESFKEEALRALGELQTTSLKGLLRRVVSKIFSLELGSWCSEFEARNAPGGPARPNLLGDSTALVADFLRSQEEAAGGFADREGKADLYYTVFGIEALLALRQPLPVERLWLSPLLR